MSMEFSRQEYWSGLPFPSSGDLPDPGIEPRSPALQADALQKNSPTNARDVGWSLGQEDSLEKEMVTHASILAWEIPSTVARQDPLSTESQKTRLKRLNKGQAGQCFPFQRGNAPSSLAGRWSLPENMCIYSTHLLCLIIAFQEMTWRAEIKHKWNIEPWLLVASIAAKEST